MTKNNNRINNFITAKKSLKEEGNAFSLNPCTLKSPGTVQNCKVLKYMQSSKIMRNPHKEESSLNPTHLHGLFVVVISMLAGVTGIASHGPKIASLKINNDVIDAAVIGVVEARWQVLPAVNSHPITNTR